jgi:hypothetical protein
MRDDGSPDDARPGNGNDTRVRDDDRVHSTSLSRDNVSADAMSVLSLRVQPQSRERTRVVSILYPAFPISGGASYLSTDSKRK